MCGPVVFSVPEVCLRASCQSALALHGEMEASVDLRGKTCCQLKLQRASQASVWRLVVRTRSWQAHTITNQSGPVYMAPTALELMSSQSLLQLALAIMQILVARDQALPGPTSERDHRYEMPP